MGWACEQRDDRGAGSAGRQDEGQRGPAAHHIFWLNGGESEGERDRRGGGTRERVFVFCWGFAQTFCCWFTVVSLFALHQGYGG